MKHGLLKRLVQLLLSVLLVGQIQLFYLSLKHDGIPISNTLFNKYLPENLRLQSEQVLFFFPYHFRITEATLSEKASHQIQIKLPYINLSWSPYYTELDFNRWSLRSPSGTVLSNYYPSELKLSQLKLAFAEKGIERGFVQLQDGDKIFYIRYQDRYTLPIQAVDSPVDWEAPDIDKNPLIPQLIQSIHSSKNTTLHCSLERTPENRLAFKASGSSELISYASYRLEALQINARFEEPEFTLHFRGRQFKNTAFGLQCNSMIGQYRLDNAHSKPELLLSTDSIRYKNYRIEYATAQIKEGDRPARTIEASLFHQGNSLQIKTGYKDSSPTRALYFNGHIEPQSLIAIVPELNAVPQLALASETFHTTGHLQLNSALEPLEAEGSLQGTDFRLGDKGLDYLNARFKYTKSQLETEAELRVAERHLSINSKIHLGDQDYRFLLKGSLYPTEFDGLLPSWWQSIFQKFSFTSKSHIQADFSIHGNFKNPIPDQFLGSVIAEEIYYRSVHFPHGRLRVQGANYCTLITLDDIHMDIGQARGWLMTTVQPDGFQEIESLRIDLIGALGTQNAARLFGNKTAQVLDTFESNRAHEFAFEAAFFHPHYRQHSGKSYYNLFINTEKPFSFFQRPFDSLQAEIYGRNSEHYIRSASAGFAEGTAHFQADITQTLSDDPQIHLVLQLSECDFDLSSQYLFNQIQSTKPSALNREVELDLELESKGALFDFTRHLGYGSLKIEGEQLSQIYLLGPFSKALDELNIPIGTFKLDQLESRFQIRAASIQVPELKINGKQSHVYGSGQVQIPDQAIDFDIKIDPLKNANLSFTLFGEIGRRLNPVTHILHFKVSGTAKEQKWRSRFDPRNLLGL